MNTAFKAMPERIGMFIFEADYIDMDTDAEITRKIEFNGQSFDSEKECYLYAMSQAYEMAAENEMLTNLRFIAS